MRNIMLTLLQTLCLIAADEVYIKEIKTSTLPSLGEWVGGAGQCQK